MAAELDDVRTPTAFAPLLWTRAVASLVSLVAIALILSLVDGGALSYALVVLALGIAVLSPAAAVTSIAVALPFIHRPVAVGNSSFSLLELAILFAALSVAIQLLFDMVRARSARPIDCLLRPLTITAVALLLMIAGAVSLSTVADSRYRPDSLREFRWVIVEPVIALFLFRWALQRGLRWLLVGAFLATGVAVAVAGILQLTVGSGVVIADGVERATGPYRHPNNLALYLERVAVLALGLAVFSRKRGRLLPAATAIATVGLAATLSRGAAMAYLAGASWIVSAARIRSGWRWIGAGAVAALALLAILGTERLTDRGSSGATSSRVLIWSSSVEMIRDHPITGVGLDQFFNQYGRRYVDPAGWPERYTSHPHNLVLDFWLRLGVPGLVCLGGLVAVVVRLIVRRSSERSDQAIWAGAAGVLVAGTVHGMVDNGFFLPDLATITWLMIALLEPAASSISSGHRDE